MKGCYLGDEALRYGTSDNKTLSHESSVNVIDVITDCLLTNVFLDFICDNKDEIKNMMIIKRF